MRICGRLVARRDVVGHLALGSLNSLTRFHRGLAEAGYTEGRKAAIEHHLVWGDMDNSRI